MIVEIKISKLSFYSDNKTYQIFLLLLYFQSFQPLKLKHEQLSLVHQYSDTF